MIDRKSLDLLSQAILDHLSANPELIGALVAESGLLPGDLRYLAADPTPAFGAALVDFICTTDERLAAFSAESGWAQQTVAHMREALSAGSRD